MGSDSGYKPATPRNLTLFHGTSWTDAQSIQCSGFIQSEGGCLGAGMYLGQRDKATRFAGDSSRHQGSAGGLVEVMVTVENPKYHLLYMYRDTYYVTVFLKGQALTIRFRKSRAREFLRSSVLTSGTSAQTT